MRYNELISKFTIAVTNEESELLDKIDDLLPVESFVERDQFVIENLVRKSLLSKVNKNGVIFVRKNCET